MAVTPKLFYVYNSLQNNTNDDSVDDLPSTGGPPVSLGTDVGGPDGRFRGLAIDSASGVYFITSNFAANDDSVIYEEHFGQAPTYTTNIIDIPAQPLVDDAVNSLALNASDDILYYASGTGFFEEKFTGANFSGTHTNIQLATLQSTTGPASQQIAFDQADHSAYFAAPFDSHNLTFTGGGKTTFTGSGLTKNFIYMVSNVTVGAAPNSLTSQIVGLGGSGGELPISDGEVSGIALDTKTDTLYIVTRPGVVPSSTNVEGLYAYNIAAKTLSTVWSQADPAFGSTNALNDMTYITVDSATGDYYVSNEGSKAPGIYKGNVGSSALPTPILSLTAPTLNPPTAFSTKALAFDPNPTVASDNVSAIDGVLSHTTGTITTADNVTITVAFSQNVFVTGTPTLTLNDGGAAQYISGSGTVALVFRYIPANGQNTQTLAATGVSGGTIADSAGTAADLTNAVQTFTGLRVQTTPPVVVAGGAVQYSEIGSPVALDPGLTVSDPNGTGQLQSATVKITTGFLAGDVLTANVTGTSITATYNAAGTLTLTGADTLAHYQSVLDSVTYSSTSADARSGGADVSRTITWSVNDGVFSNATTQTSTVNIVPCFVRGARILTERGEVEVENLTLGDIAITASGRRRPIVWIGHRALDLTRHPDPAAVRPVRVRAGAFGEALPHRDLWLSPGHSIASDGVLIAAGLLINGCSVAQVAQDRVEYWHVELDAHDVLLGEGLAAESYLDTGNRAAFANSGAFVEAHPDFRPKHWAATCLPLAFEGPALSATRARLFARLSADGYEVDREAEPFVLVDGQRINPIRLTLTRLAFVLPGGGHEIALRSNVFVPAHTVVDSMDTRELGLCVSRLEIDGEKVAIEVDEGDTPGWRNPEYAEGRFSHRWTTGATPLPPGARIAIVDLAGEGYYWRRSERRESGSDVPIQAAIGA